jgi:hypothetical protein
MIFDIVHLLFRIRIRIHNLKLRIRILQKVSDPYGSGSGSTTLASTALKVELVHCMLWDPPGGKCVFFSCNKKLGYHNGKKHEYDVGMDL